MRTYHWNGEYWYRNDASLLRRALTWLVWLGGWGVFGGWRVFSTPIALFGHRLTFYGWGEQLRIGGGYLVFSRCGGARKLYWSTDGTPSGAVVWFAGVPYDVRRSVEQRAAAIANRPTLDGTRAT